MLKDDMAIHAGIPEKVILGALRQLSAEMEDVTWDMGRTRPGRPVKVFFEAETIADVQRAKRHLEKLLGDAGYDLIP